MRTNVIRIVITVGALVLFTGSMPANSAERLTEEQKALHVLNRLGFGPRPGDVERVLALGVERHITLQLHPERIDDDATGERLARLEVPHMSERELYETFQKPFFEALQERRRRERNGEQANGEEAERQMLEARRRVPRERRPQRIVQELSAAKVIRAVESERQLEEVMADFWLNHFNVSGDKGIDRFLIASYERDVIRPNMWGTFEELLLATAKSPAMLFYLDNARSVAVEANRPAVAPGRTGPRRARELSRSLVVPSRRSGMREQLPRQVRNAGLNENYARELLELHTLGVDGGYTQQDVTELARVLTGWSIDGQRGDQPVAFVYRETMHDVKPKTVLGYTFGAGGGMEEGEKMIHVLAHHPSTARHIATKLCQRFVADDPPAALVDRVAKQFLRTGGDLRATVEAVVTSSEFFDPLVYRAKTKTPFEYVVSAIRAVDGSTDGRSSAKAIADMGQPLYLCQPPTGYSDAARDWISSGALLARLNYSISLAANRVMGTNARLSRDDLPDSDLVGALATKLIGGDLSEGTRSAIEARFAGESDTDPVVLAAGLILGSPEFQRQ
jgi:uncharacterized protein (DUF1800 family)